MSVIDDWTPWQRIVVFCSRQLVRIPTLGRVRVEGLDELAANLDITSGPLIVVANHASNLDPPLVAGWLAPVLRRRSSVLAKEGLFRGPVAGMLRATGCIPVKVGGSDMEAVRATRAVIDRGDVLLIFPEGTRSRDGVIGPVHSGTAMLASRPGVRVLPVGVSGTDRLLGKAQRFPRLGTRVTLRFGEPFVVVLDPTLPRRQALAAVSAEIMRRIGALVDQRQRGASTTFTDSIDAHDT